MKKKASLIVTIMLMLAVSISGLLYVFYDVAQYVDRVQAREKVQESQGLQELKLSLKEFNSIADKEEFRIGGKLYDMGSYVVVNDSVTITAFHDEPEEGLVNDIVESFGPCSSISGENCNHFSRVLLYPPEFGKSLVSAPRLDFHSLMRPVSVSTRYIAYLSGAYSGLVYPPPRFPVA